jgi:hypothetical protein
LVAVLLFPLKGSLMLVKGLLTQMSGSLGGITASHNRGGMYLRARTVPTDPGSLPQLAVRALVAQLAGLWGSTLTAAQRAAWDTYAANVSIVNRLGDTVFLTGFQHYVRSNVPRLQASEPRVDDGPTIFDLGDYTAPTLTIAGGGSTLSVAFTVTDEWVGEDDAILGVWASREKASTINFFKGPYRFAGKIEGNAALPPTSPASITSPFPYTTGNRGFMQVRVSRADGRLSAFTRTFALAS